MTLTSTPVDYGTWAEIRRHSDIKGKYAHPHVVTAGLLRVGYPSVDNMLDVPLQPPSKVFEHGRTTGEDNVLRTTSQRKLHNAFHQRTLYSPLLTSIGLV
jgi:hypothetical protein